MKFSIPKEPPTGFRVFYYYLSDAYPFGKDLVEGYAVMPWPGKWQTYERVLIGDGSREWKKISDWADAEFRRWASTDDDGDMWAALEDARDAYISHREQDVRDTVKSLQAAYRDIARAESLGRNS